jgi:metal-responsive CopG/Arc/MetJ family transcriptional regulator
MSKRINITIDLESLAELDRQAKAEGRSRSAHIRELVKAYQLATRVRT